MKPAQWSEEQYASALERTNPEVLNHIGKAAAVTVRRYWVDLEAAIAMKSNTDIEQAARSIKGMLGYFGADPAAHHAAQVQEHANRGDQANALLECRKMRREIELFLRVMERKTGFNQGIARMR
ncbi:MAG: Hpt domain-containing protein [Burkholderiaceae bacterium]|nr:Hpt domain-containing protein [Burkholderiaceae bacterium]